tara:strand:- start:84 stop:563 length:480 start_codon:yes stop_codon:yes gene_type:complete
MALTKINNNTLSAVTTLPSAIATGKVLQTVSMLNATQTTTTSASMVDTPVTLAITPSSTSNKVLIIVNISSIRKTGDMGVELKLQTGSTVLSFFGGNIADNGSAAAQTVSGQGTSFLHSPSTSSAITYKVTFRTSNGGNTALINNNGGTSSMTLMEIAG